MYNKKISIRQEFIFLCVEMNCVRYVEYLDFIKKYIYQ